MMLVGMRPRLRRRVAAGDGEISGNVRVCRAAVGGAPKVARADENRIRVSRMNEQIKIVTDLSGVERRAARRPRRAFVGLTSIRPVAPLARVT
jgi:hypothetical protein